MPEALVPYVGNGPYCYANATAMLLASIGEQVTPALIEVLSGVGLGAIWVHNSQDFFFSMEVPDVGVSRALEILGFCVEEDACDDTDQPPLEELARALTAGPAMLGPLDMGLLTYVPGRGSPIGADHYVLAYALREGAVHLHDPAGYPHVSLGVGDLVEAWRAERIGYRRGAFRWWHSPLRVRDVSHDQIVEGAILAFQAIYREADAVTGPGPLFGASAIRHWGAEIARTDPPSSLQNTMVGFLFPLGAQRALDYAAFFSAPCPSLAGLKADQAALFGECYMRGVRRDWTGLEGSLMLLAEIEDRFRDALLTLS